MDAGREGWVASRDIVRIAMPPAGPTQLQDLRTRLSAAWETHPSLVAVEATEAECDEAVVAVLLATRSAAKFAGVRVVLVATRNRDGLIERIGPVASKLLGLTPDSEQTQQ